MGGITGQTHKFDEWRQRVASIFSDLAPDLKLVGELAAEAIVRTTLAGIGAGDTAFAPYSPAYQAMIDAVGGKPQQTVNLRGLFYHEGQKRVKYRSEARRQQFRADRQAYVNVRFLMSRRAQVLNREGRGASNIPLADLIREAVNPGNPRMPILSGFRTDTARRGLALFTARTGVTRPARGVTDQLSEMSLDLISVVVEATAGAESLKIIYKPRKKAYMIIHNKGDGKIPQRKWFTLDKAAVKGAIIEGFRTIIKARMLRAKLAGGGPGSTGGGGVPAGPVAPAVAPGLRQGLP